MTPSERLAALARGENPLLVARLASGYVVMAENQYLPGYCLLLADPLSPRLNDLTGDPRAAFLADMARVGDALLAVTDAVRINYGIYGNVDPFVHAHIWPRNDHEPPDLRTLPPMGFPASVREAPATRYAESTHGELRQGIGRLLKSWTKSETELEKA
jgi:diadenosine tetraphosphate (Ap4A) HIT family hydrolase